MAQTRRRLPCLRGRPKTRACRAYAAPTGQNHLHFITTSTYHRARLFDAAEIAQSEPWCAQILARTALARHGSLVGYSPGMAETFLRHEYQERGQGGGETAYARQPHQSAAWSPGRTSGGGQVSGFAISRTVLWRRWFAASPRRRHGKLRRVCATPAVCSINTAFRGALGRALMAGGSLTSATFQK